MPRSVSSTLSEAMMSGETSVILLTLVEISHPYLETPIRLVNNYEDISSNGVVYTACDMRIYRPDQTDSSRYVGRIEVDNTDQILTPTIRSLRGSFTVKLTLVTQTDLDASPPEFDTVELGPVSMTIETIPFNETIARINLVHRNITVEKFPKHIFDSVSFPGGQ